MKPLLLLLFLLCWAFPLPAQERVETTAGPVERRTFAGGSTLVLQALTDRPVAAVTLVMPWGRGHDPQACEFLNQILARCGGRYPAGTLLLRLEEIGGLASYQTGQSWSSFTLVVPRGYAGWATRIQLDRLSGQWLQGEDLSGLLSTYAAPGNLDATRLRSLYAQRWNPSQAVLSLVGGYDAAEVQSMLARLPALKATRPGPAAATTDFLPNRLGWSYPRPTQARQRAAAWLWRTALRSQDQEVQLDLSPAQDDYWLSTASQGGLEAARRKLLAAAPDSGLLVTLPLRQQAVLEWLEDWDDLANRSSLLGFQQAHGELGQDLQTYEALKTYDPLQWKTDMAWVGSHGEGLPVMLAPPAKNAGSRSKPRPTPALPAASPAAPPAFVRLEPTPGCSVLIQTVADLPVVSVRAVLPGGNSCDAAALAGRAEWLAAYWQAGFEPELPTRVEAQPYGWQFSAYLPREQACAWVSKWLQIWSSSKFDPVLAARCQPSPSGSAGALQQGYREWLRLLFPPDHPLGREGQRVALAPERLQELQNEVRQRGRWNLFITGSLTGNDLTPALNVVPVTGELGTGNLETLPTTNPGDRRDLGPVIHPAEVSRCTLLVGGHGPSRREADYYAFVLLLQALAADPLRSRLQMELRLKQPLVERVDCNFLSSSAVAPWLLRIDCSPSNLAQVQARLKEQMEALRSQEISPEELRLAISRLEGQQQVACKNSTGMVLQLRNLELFRLSDSYNQGFAGIYHNVSAKDVLSSARLRLAPERVVSLILTPKE
ncbi:MAG: insulinase family protein [Candidatus Eremiobacteraeota bacterium]|nr:insulinase family protein [Candidatus Eremiobacteraeota bacterium]MCW5872573.1 insulinase family protein [Candidatus Eremiobacteraeota bacterium]